MLFSQKLIAMQCLSAQKTLRFRSTCRGPYFKSKGICTNTFPTLFPKPCRSEVA